MRKNSISLYDWCKKNNKNVLLNEWDYLINKITPKDVSRASHYKAHWICKECNNNFIMEVQNRTLQNSKCPKCSSIEAHNKERKRIIEVNGSLEATHPEILKKWNYERNTTIQPTEVSRYSCIKVWWKCPTCGHEFQSRIADVKNENTCRKCRGNELIDIGRDGKYCVYCHTCPNGKKYIGYTGLPLKIRFGNGQHYSTECKFGKAIDEFGWGNIQHEVLESGLTKEQASEKEREYISLYKTTQEEYGYNVSDGGINGKVFGRICSEDTKEKISKSNKGKIRSKETKEKLRKSHLGKKTNNVRAVIKMDLDGNEIQEYRSIIEAVRQNDKVERTCVWECCTGRRKTSGGYRWKYKE